MSKGNDHASGQGLPTAREAAARAAAAVDAAALGAAGSPAAAADAAATASQPDQHAAPTRSGKLMSKLALLMVALIVTAIALSSVLTYANTASAYLQSEGERLHQVGQYARSSAESSNGASLVDTYAYWKEHTGQIDPQRTVAQQLALLNEQYDALSTEAERLDALGTPSQEDLDAFSQMEEAYNDENSLYLYYSMADMLDRLKRTFNVSSLCLYEVRLDQGQAYQIMEGTAADQVRGQGDVYALGQLVSCTQQEYPLLWETAQSGTEQEGLEISPDGKYYLAYVPLQLEDGTVWVFETSILASSLVEVVPWRMADTMIISTLVLAVCLIASLLLLRRMLVKPLAELDGRVRDYARSKDASVAGAIRAGRFPNDEIGTLADNVAAMIDRLQQHMTSIRSMSAERERVKSELAVASRIQLSALPAVRPPFSGGDSFDLSASMHPAKEVGGDFYDFFLIDGTRCGVVIADVSGKGVPAALFMMRAKALLKQLLADGLEPAEAMRQANDSLCADNEAGMFVTVWLGVLDVKTGQLAFANGGHNPPVYHHANGQAEWLRDRSGLLLGSFDGVPYKGFQRRMEPGDTLLLYTDGVTEAMDVHDHCYGDDRLLNLVASLQGMQPHEMTAAVEADVHAFAEGAEQADDITMLALRFSGEENGVITAFSGDVG